MVPVGVWVVSCITIEQLPTNFRNIVRMNAQMSCIRNLKDIHKRPTCSPHSAILNECLSRSINRSDKPQRISLEKRSPKRTVRAQIRVENNGRVLFLRTTNTRSPNSTPDFDWKGFVDGRTAGGLFLTRNIGIWEKGLQLRHVSFHSFQLAS